MNSKTLYIAIVLFVSFQSFGTNKTDSIRSQLKNAKSRQKIEILHTMVFNNWLNQPDSAQKFAERALSISRELQDAANISKSLRLLGGTFSYKGEYEKALEYSSQSLDIAIQANDSSLIHNSLNNIGYIHINLGNYQNALEYLMRSYKIKTQLNTIYGVEHTLNNIGIIYAEANMFDSAHHYFEQGLAAAKRNNNYDIILYSLNNIGELYLKQSNYEKSRLYFQKSLDKLKTIKNKNWQSVALRGMGEICLNEHNYDSAEYFFNQSFNIRQSIGDRKGMSEAYLWLARLALKQNNNNLSLAFLAKSDSISKILEHHHVLLEIYEEKAKVYKAKGDFEKSNRFLTMSSKLKDSLFVNILGRNLNLVPLKLKENENLLLLKDSEIALQEKELQNFIYISLLILAIPFGLMMMLMMKRNRKINQTLTKQNTKVESQNEEIESQKEYLELNLKELERVKNIISTQKDELEILNEQLAGTVDERNTELKSINERLRTTSLELDNFIYKSSHDIKGPISRLMGICDLALKDVEDKKALRYLGMLDKAALRLNVIIDELKLISELQNKVLEHRQIDFREIVQETFNEVVYIENIKKFDLQIATGNNDIYYSDESLIRLLVFNIIQNALQLMKSQNLTQCKIDFTVSHHERTIKITFKLVNLKLIDGESEKLIHDFSKAQNEYDNISIGLYTVKQCLMKLNGDLQIDSAGENDTTFEVVLPKAI